MPLPSIISIFRLLSPSFMEAVLLGHTNRYDEVDGSRAPPRLPNCSEVFGHLETKRGANRAAD